MTPIGELILRYQTASTLEERNQAADVLLEVVYPRMHLFLAKHVTDDVLDDVLQTAMIGVFQGMTKYKYASDKQFWGWCHKIARFKACDHWRQHSRERLKFSAPEDIWQAVNASMEDAPISPEEREQLALAMSLLADAKPPCVDYLLSRYMYDWDNKTIAKEYGLKYASVHVTIKRCLEKAQTLASKLS